MKIRETDINRIYSRIELTIEDRSEHLLAMEALRYARSIIVAGNPGERVFRAACRLLDGLYTVVSGDSTEHEEEFSLDDDDATRPIAGRKDGTNA